jgi:hypothetical protein
LTLPSRDWSNRSKLIYMPRIYKTIDILHHKTSLTSCWQWSHTSIERWCRSRSNPIIMPISKTVFICFIFFLKRKKITRENLMSKRLFFLNKI